MKTPMLSCAFFLAMTIGAHSADITPLVNNSKNPTDAEAEKALQELSELLVLDANSARQYSSNLQKLVGRYYYVVQSGDINKIVPLKRLNDNELTISDIQLKDKVYFKKVTDSNWRLGVTIPWLNLSVDGGDRLETVIQDIASMATTTTANIEANIPAAAPADKEIYFIESATVTVVNQKRYSKTSGEGSIPILSGGGGYMKDILSNAWVVSVGNTLVRQPTRTSSVPRPMQMKGQVVIVEEQE